MLRTLIVPLVCCWMFIAVTSTVGQSPLLLFHSKQLADWDFYVDKEDVKVEDVFTFTDDRLLCKGKPFGYLATKESYKNFKFSVEWRWGTEPTNSGIFLKITDQPKGAFLPKAVEVQLQHKNVGDIWAFYGRTIIEPANRLESRENEAIGKFMGVRKILDAELPVLPQRLECPWNRMEVLCVDSLIVVVVNGAIVNWTTGAEAIEGRIGFQSEGGPIEFRNAMLTVLP